MYNKCVLLVVSALVAMSVQVDDVPCVTIADKDLAQNFDWANHKGEYIVVNHTKSSYSTDQACIKENYELGTGNNLTVKYTAFNTKTEKDVKMEGVIEFEAKNHARLTVKWHENDPYTRNVVVLDTNYNSTLFYSCANTGNETHPVHEHFVGIVAKKAADVDGTRLAVLEAVLNRTHLANIPLDFVDMNKCSASGTAQTTLALSLALIALLFCLIRQ